MAAIAAMGRRSRLLSPCWFRVVSKTMSTSGKKENMIGEDTVIVEHLPEITLIGINRPEKRNCVNTPTAEALLQEFQNFDKDDSAKIAVLYGVGGNFCAGYDLKELSENPPLSLASYGRGPMVGFYGHKLKGIL